MATLKVRGGGVGGCPPPPPPPIKPPCTPTVFPLVYLKWGGPPCLIIEHYCTIIYWLLLYIYMYYCTEQKVPYEVLHSLLTILTGDLNSLLTPIPVWMSYSAVHHSVYEGSSSTTIPKSRESYSVPAQAFPTYKNC